MIEVSNLKNIAVVAHVDHGKTTLVDELLKQSGAFTEREEVAERVMDSGELEKEKGITITAKNCAISWKETKINLLDTPGHADFGGEVERGLVMVDGIILLVDAAEGPLPQTRFVMQKAMERGLKIALLINKVDRHDARPDEVQTEVEDLLLELASFLELEDFDLDIPVLYSSAKEGWASSTLEDPRENMDCLLDFMIGDYFPHPSISEGDDFQLLIANLSYSNYKGELSIGRIQRGKVKKHQTVTCIGEEKNKNFKISSIQVFDTLGTKEVDHASAGEIVVISGITEPMIGDTITNLEKPEPLTRLKVDPPTVSVNV